MSVAKKKSAVVASEVAENEIVGSVKGMHHKEDLQDILNRLRSGETVEAVAKHYDKRVSQIRDFARQNGVSITEPEYYQTVDQVMDNLKAKFYDCHGDKLREVIQRLLNGDSPSQVAKDLGKSIGAVTSFAAKNKIKLPEGRKGRREGSGLSYNPEQVAKVLDLKKQGFNVGAIANQTGLAYNGVVRILRSQTTRSTAPRPELPSEEVIRKHHSDGYTQTQIATMLSVPLHRITKAFKEYGLSGK